MPTDISHNWKQISEVKREVFYPTFLVISVQEWTWEIKSIFMLVMKKSKGRKHSDVFWMHMNNCVFKLGTHIPDNHNFSWDFYLYLQIELLF